MRIPRILLEPVNVRVCIRKLEGIGILTVDVSRGFYRGALCGEGACGQVVGLAAVAGALCVIARNLQLFAADLYLPLCQCYDIILRVLAVRLSPMPQPSGTGP